MRGKLLSAIISKRERERDGKIGSDGGTWCERREGKVED